MSLVEQFQLFRRILCVCPCCGDLVRVSDLRLKTKELDVKTWLDNYDSKVLQVSKKEETFAEKEDALRKKAVEKGRNEAKECFNNAICPTLKSLKYDPNDIKPVFYPIDYVIFNGMNKEKVVTDIILLSKSICPSLDSIRQNVSDVVINKDYNWQVARIDNDGNISFD